MFTCATKMFGTAAVVALFSALSVRGAPAPVTDTSIMQYALNLEHIELAFYNQGLEKYDAQAFADAGYEAWVRGRFVQIRDHEVAHVTFLTEQLGCDAPVVCNYTYPYTDLQSWVSLSQTLEHVGAAAYMGASRFVDDKDVLAASVSISHIEARQAGWVNSAVMKQEPWDGDFETPLYFSGAWSLAVGFIESCPESNPALPVASFPALNVSNSAPPMGSNITVSYAGQGNITTPTYMAWYHDMNTTFTSIDEHGVTTVPDYLRGTVFAGVVRNETETTNDSTMLSGLTIFKFPFSSYAIVGA